MKDNYISLYYNEKYDSNLDVFLSNYATNKASYDLNELITHNEMYIKKELYRKESYINYQNPNFERDMMFREDFHFQR
jgi:hypothetical protein